MSAAEAKRARAQPMRTATGTAAFPVKTAFPVKKPYCMLPTKVRAGSESSFAITRAGMALPVDTRYSPVPGVPAASLRQWAWNERGVTRDPSSYRSILAKQRAHHEATYTDEKLAEGIIFSDTHGPNERVAPISPW